MNSSRSFSKFEETLKLPCSNVFLPENNIVGPQTLSGQLTLSSSVLFKLPLVRILGCVHWHWAGRCTLMRSQSEDFRYNSYVMRRNSSYHKQPGRTKWPEPSVSLTRWNNRRNQTEAGRKPRKLLLVVSNQRGCSDSHAHKISSLRVVSNEGDLKSSTFPPSRSSHQRRCGHWCLRDSCETIVYSCSTRKTESFPTVFYSIVYCPPCPRIVGQQFPRPRHFQYVVF